MFKSPCLLPHLLSVEERCRTKSPPYSSDGRLISHRCVDNPLIIVLIVCISHSTPGVDRKRGTCNSIRGNAERCCRMSTGIPKVLALGARRVRVSPQKEKRKWCHATVARIIEGFYALDFDACIPRIWYQVFSVNYAYLYLSLDES